MRRISQHDWDNFVTFARNLPRVNLSISKQGTALYATVGYMFRWIMYFPIEGAISGHTIKGNTTEQIKWLSNDPSEWLRFIGQ